MSANPLNINLHFSRKSGLYRYSFNGKEKDNESFQGAYDFGARIHDGRLGRWYSGDKEAYKCPAEGLYNSVFNNPLKFVDPDGNYPMPVITNEITGYTIARVYGSGSTRAIVVPTYKMIVYDVSEKGELVPLASFNVTRDGWYSNGVCEGDNGRNYELLVNRCSEQTKEQGKTEISIEPTQDSYAGCDGNYSFGAIQCEEINPASNTFCNGDPLPKDVIRSHPGTAKSVMIHIGGYYTNSNGSKSWGGTYGCYGIVDPSQIKGTEKEAEEMKSSAL